MEKKMSKKKIIALCVFAAIIVALLVGVIGYIAGWFEKGYDADVVTVKEKTIVATYDTSGTVTASSEGSFPVTADVKVTAVNVRVGSVVKAGDVLATFDASSLQQVLKEKQTALAQAQKAYDDYRSGVADAKKNLATINSRIAAAEKKVAQLEAAAEQEKKAAAQAQSQAAAQEAQAAQENLSGIISDSTLAGKIIDNIVNSSQSLQQLKSVLESISSMRDMSQVSSMMSAMGAGSSQYELMQAQVELATLKANQTVSETQANGSLETVYQSVVEAAQKGYEKTRATIAALESGWVAEKDGIVSEVNIKAGETVQAAENAQNAGNMDMSSVLSAVTSGGDVASLVSGLFAADVTGMKVQYYPLEVKFVLNKGDLEKVHLGQKVNVQSGTGATLPGEVTYIAAVATSNAGLDISSLLNPSGGAGGGIEATVSVKQPDSGMIIGLDTDISIDVEEKQNCLTVPVESIQYDDSTAYVFVYDANEGTILRKDVSTGIFDGTYYEITDGISKGDIIIRTPTAQMAEGDKVIAHNVD